jgi:hypothetical protein
MKILEWLKKWWVLSIVGILILLYLYIYLWNNPHHPILLLIQFLISSLVSVGILLYVVYTRELTISSQETVKASRMTAEANIRLVESMQSMLLEQWSCELRENVHLERCGEDISRSIHIEDKRMPEANYIAYLGSRQKRILIFKPLNCGSRPVILNSVKFQISDTRSRKPREISYDPQIPLVLNRDQEKEIFVAYNLEGEMDIRVVEISYQDGDKTQTKWIANSYKEIERYQEPKSETPAEEEYPF